MVNSHWKTCAIFYQRMFCCCPYVAELRGNLEKRFQNPKFGSQTFRNSPGRYKQEKIRQKDTLLWISRELLNSGSISGAKRSRNPFYKVVFGFFLLERASRQETVSADPIASKRQRVIVFDGKYRLVFATTLCPYFSFLLTRNPIINRISYYV